MGGEGERGGRLGSWIGPFQVHHPAIARAYPIEGGEGRREERVLASWLRLAVVCVYLWVCVWVCVSPRAHRTHHSRSSFPLQSHGPHYGWCVLALPLTESEPAPPSLPPF